MDDRARKLAALAEIAAKRDARLAAAENYRLSAARHPAAADTLEDLSDEDEDPISGSLDTSPYKPRADSTAVDALVHGVSRLGLAHSNASAPGSYQAPKHLLAASALSLPSSPDADSPGLLPTLSAQGREDTLEDSDYESAEELPLRASKPILPPIQRESSSKESSPLVLDDKYTLGGGVASKLYPHQVDGVKWLWSLNKMQKGGILGDDMGLGKTMQCSAFLAGLFKSQLAKRVMVVAPKTLLAHWSKELAVCGLGSRTFNYFGGESERDAALRAVASQYPKSGGVMLTTYGMVLHNSKQLRAPPYQPFRPVTSSSDDSSDSSKFAWDWILLDEGHKLKNPKMKLAEALLEIPAKVRLIISGTPIQNNLMEMHALFQLCCGDLLGDAKYFKRVYEKPITSGQCQQASERARVVGSGVAAQLRHITAPFFLRREKKDVLVSRPSGSSREAGAHGSSSSEAVVSNQGGASPQSISHKNDLVVWLKLSPLQQDMYQAFLNSETVKTALNETQSPLAALTVLKKICDHPALLSAKSAAAIVSGGRNRWNSAAAKGGKGAKGDKQQSRTKHGYDEDDFVVDDEEDGTTSDDKDSVTSDCEEVRDQVQNDEEESLQWSSLAEGVDFHRRLVEEMERKGPDASCKSLFVLALLKQLDATGHRTLIFSQSRVMLDILQSGIKSTLNMSFCRIDGSMDADERHNQVKRFQAPGAKIPVFLLTSQVGGLGLTLTAADRVIIVDPNWNPSIDNQSVDRAYRIGQKRDVVVYRLITCGTVEEKIYRKQVFKGGLSRTGTSEGVQFRYFAMSDLRDLFTVTKEGLASSQTQKQLHEMHAAQRTQSEELTQHLLFLDKQESFAGISDHDLLFSRPSGETGSTAEEGRQMILQMQAARTADSYGSATRPGAGGKGSGKYTVRPNAPPNELSAMLQSMQSMQLGGRTVEEREAEQRRKQLAELDVRIRSLTTSLANLGSSMPDGGEKMKHKKKELEEELEELLGKERSNHPVLPAAGASMGTSQPSASQGAVQAPARSTAAGPDSLYAGARSSEGSEGRERWPTAATAAVAGQGGNSRVGYEGSDQRYQLPRAATAEAAEAVVGLQGFSYVGNEGSEQRRQQPRAAAGVAGHEGGNSRAKPEDGQDPSISLGTPHSHSQRVDCEQPSSATASMVSLDSAGPGSSQSTGRRGGLNLSYGKARKDKAAQEEAVVLCGSDDESFVSAQSSVVMSGCSPGMVMGGARGDSPSSRPPLSANNYDVVDLSDD